jgi:hypothetical protein
MFIKTIEKKHFVSNMRAFVAFSMYVNIVERGIKHPWPIHSSEDSITMSTTWFRHVGAYNTFYWSVCNQPGKVVIMYICPRGIDFAFVFTIVRLDYGLVPTAYFLFCLFIFCFCFSFYYIYCSKINKDDF